MTIRSCPVFCESAELAVEAAAVAQGLGLAIETELSAHPLDAAARAARADEPAVALCAEVPDPATLVAALDACSAAELVILGALGDRHAHGRGLAADLGFVCVSDVGPALTALALADQRIAAALESQCAQDVGPGQASPRGRLGTSERGAGAPGLPGRGRARLSARRRIRGDRPGPCSNGGRGAAARWPSDSSESRASHRAVLPQDLSASRDVLFGPPRLLSDPASKAALAPFGLPMPQEELCTSPSRASAEAARIGFPVRISLASPDLRVWDHPDLSVDGVDNAARVRDVYRQLMSVAAERAPDARVLGVTVTATTLARALMRVTARPDRRWSLLLRVGFADPHGATVRDAISTVLPANPEGVERALARLAGHRLLLGEGAAERERNLAAAQRSVRSHRRLRGRLRRESRAGRAAPGGAAGRRRRRDPRGRDPGHRRLPARARLTSGRSAPSGARAKKLRR